MTGYIIGAIIMCIVAVIAFAYIKVMENEDINGDMLGIAFFVVVLWPLALVILIIGALIYGVYKYSVIKMTEYKISKE